MNEKNKSDLEKRKERLKYIDEWRKENLTRIVIQPRKEEAQAIKEYAAAHGMSTQAFILSAIRSAMGK